MAGMPKSIKSNQKSISKGSPAFRMSIDPSPMEILNVDFSNYTEHKEYIDNSEFLK